jgi:uncharacterized protein YvpB
MKDVVFRIRSSIEKEYDERNVVVIDPYCSYKVKYKRKKNKISNYFYRQDIP